MSEDLNEKKALRKNLHNILKLKPEELTKSRHDKFRRYGDIGLENIA